MNTKLLTRVTVMALLLGGVSCWSARADDAAQSWDKNCAACHGKDGKGQTKVGQKLGIKDLTDAKVQASFTDADATKAIKEGIAKDGQPKMKAFGDIFSDDEIKALVAQVRGLKK
jgi:mono/diheme cytochrome c family protein